MTTSSRPRPGRGPALAEPQPGSHRSPPDRAITDALLQAAGRGDPDAFAAFYDQTAPTVIGLLHAVLGQPARAERITEEVYLQLWRSAPTFDPTVRPATETVLRIARRALVRPFQDLLASPLAPSRQRDAQ